MPNSGKAGLFFFVCKRPATARREERFNSTVQKNLGGPAEKVFYVSLANMNVATYRNGSWEYNLLDHLGSVQVVANSTGGLVENPEYASFGKRTAGTTANARYTGKQKDLGTGLYYFGARYYDPEIGRFITADSYTNLPNDDRLLRNSDDENNKILQQGFFNPSKYNTYVYCLNNPLKLIEPDGHAVIEAVVTTVVVVATLSVFGNSKTMHSGS